jgi:tetratricopeptide (TPR) repeat protein
LNEDENNHVITEDVVINGKSNAADSKSASSKASSRTSSIKSLNSNSSNKKEPDVIEDEASMAEQAEKYKNEGNNSYKNANYRESIEFYSKAIDLCPKNAAYYGNRAAAYLMLNKYKETIEDAKMSTSLDDKFVKV